MDETRDNRTMGNFPTPLVGGVLIQRPCLWGLWKRSTKVLLELRYEKRVGPTKGPDTYDAEVDLFIDQVTVSTTHAGVLKVNTGNRDATFTAAGGELKISGRLTEDDQRMVGCVDIQGPSGLSVSGIPIEMEWVEDDE